MLFLQTGDWHLGKIFYERSLIEDQAFFLHQITSELEKSKKKGEMYDALVVPGDIYDRSIPPSEAVTLFSSFLAEIHNSFPELEMFFLAGNHDSASRLSFAAELLASQKVHICTGIKNMAEPVVVGSEGKKAAVYQIPFLTPGCIPSDKNDEVIRCQQDLTKKAVEIIKESHSKNHSDLPFVVCAHLFTCGASVSDSERSFVGTTEQVDLSVFKGITYTALGHIHKAQQFENGSVCYSGAPLAYSFGENADKCMLRVNVSSDNSVTVQKIPVTPLHPVVRLSGTFEDFYKPLSKGSVEPSLKNSYIEFQCTDNLVHENAMHILSSGYPYLLSFTRKASSSNEEESSILERKKVLSGQNKDEGAIFDLFMKDLYGESFEGNTDDEKSLYKKEKDLFSTLATEVK